MIDFKPVNELLSKPMSRTDFLKHLGAAMVGVIGIGAFLRNLTNPKVDVKTTPKHLTASSYGAGRAYGK